MSFGLFQVTQKNGVRCSAVNAFIQPVRQRENLQILTGATVEKLLLEDQTAVGVIFQKDGQQQTAFAQREVILSAGAFHSPKILLLSGIGSGKELRSLGIEPVNDLPGVGKNLQDHLAVLAAFTCSRNITLDGIERFPGVLKNLFHYLYNKQGPFGSNIAEAGGFVKTDPGLKAPDMQFHFGPVYFMEHGFVKPKGNGYSIGPQLLQPKSRGEVRLHSGNPHDAVLIDPKYLSEEEDLQKLIWGFRLAQRIGMAEAFAPYRVGPFQPATILEKDNEIAAYIRQSAEILYHPAGTCKMGYDKLAVVDDQLRVHGLHGLRVADASIMPTVIRGNTNAPVIMIAEKAADMILQDPDPVRRPAKQSNTFSK